MNFYSNLNGKVFNMGIIKPNNYTSEEINISRIMKAIGHPARKKIIDQLKSHYLTTNTELCHILNLAPSTVKEHLDMLKEVNLISETYRTHYNELILNPNGFKVVIEYVKSLEGLH